MLKWTGGSRRTVSTSRKSTQSKQKQYFEQKRRLQQIPGTDSSSEANKWDHHSDANSLDILSFVNLATIAQNKESVHTEYNSSTQPLYNLSTPAVFKKLPVHPSKPNKAYNHNNSCASQEDNGDFPKLSPAMAVKKIVSGFSNKTNESGFMSQTSSSHEAYAGAALNSTDKVGKFGENAPSIPTKSSDVKQKGKSTMQSEVSLLDLLDGEDSERNSMLKSCNEAYVSFSVKGLGKVEVETPPSSPVPYQRGCPDPPQRSARCPWNEEFQSIPSGIKMDSILQDTNLLNDFRQSERTREYGPFIDSMVSNKGIQFEYNYFPDSFDNFEGSPECGQGSPDCGLDRAFDEHICDQIWEGKRKDRYWDTNLFKSENFDGNSPNEDVFDPTLTGFEDYDDFPTLRTGMNTKRRLDLYSARASPSCSPLTVETKYLPTDSHWNSRDISKFKMKSDSDGFFSQPVWSLKDEVADLLDTTSLRSEESCSSTREVKNYSLQSSLQKHKINYMGDFQMNSNSNFNPPKLNSILCQAHQESTCRTKSSSSRSKLKKTSLPVEDMFLDSDLFSDCVMYTKSKDPSKSVTMEEQRSGTNLNFHAKGEEKHDIIKNPESEVPKGMKSCSVGEVGLGMKERHSESEGPKCESEKLLDKAENEGHSEASKCSFEGSPIVFEACANGTLNTPVLSRQFERCNLTENCDKFSPFSSQAENLEEGKGKCDTQYQVMLQSYVFQLLCVQNVLLEASGKERMK